MRLAFLILAHNDLLQLIKLISSLQHPYFDIYIAIDKKSSINNFDRISSFKNVTLVKSRHAVFWGGFSMVEAHIKLIRTAVTSGNEYGHFIMLTGLDYPIMNNNEIYQYFFETPKTEYIMAYNCSKSEFKTDLRKIEKYWIFDLPIKNKYIYRYIRYLIDRLFKIVPKKKRYAYLNGIQCDIYYGQTLSAFTKEAVNRILHVYDNDKEFKKYFRYSHAPDELYFHTIIFNSQFRENTVMKGAEHQKTLNFGWAPLHYHTYESTVKVYTEEDYNELINCGYMFCRKVTSKDSDKLLDLIDNFRSQRS